MVTELPPDPLPTGLAARRFSLHSTGGLVAEVSAYGARLMALSVPLAEGGRRDIVVGHDRAGEHVMGDRYSGAICGRVCGRISGSRFVLDGVEYRPPANAGDNLLHGGDSSFDSKLWTVEQIDGGVRFVLISPAGDAGFPGRLVATATYRFTEADTLECALLATTDAATVVNLTNHVYWNLSGDADEDVRFHRLEVTADTVLDLGPGLIPTGSRRNLAGTDLDFRRARLLGPYLGQGGGIDSCYVVGGARGTLRNVARLSHEQSGLALQLSTTEPGLQVYTGGHFGPSGIGKGGRPFCRYAGIALEPQNLPDAPNHPDFPSATLRPGELYRHVMQWQLTGMG